MTIHIIGYNADGTHASLIGPSNYWLFAVDEFSALNIFQLGATTTETIITANSRLWLEPATPTRPQASAWVGTLAEQVEPLPRPRHHRDHALAAPGRLARLNMVRGVGRLCVVARGLQGRLARRGGRVVMGHTVRIGADFNDGQPTGGWWDAAVRHVLGDLKYSTSWKGGCQSASFTLALPKGYAHPAVRASSLVEVFDGGNRVWMGEVPGDRPRGLGLHRRRAQPADGEVRRDRAPVRRPVPDDQHPDRRDDRRGSGVPVGAALVALGLLPVGQERDGPAAQLPDRAVRGRPPTHRQGLRGRR